MPKRHITIREDNILTPMSEERFYSILGHVDRNQVDKLSHAERREFVRLCRAMMNGKDIIFTHPRNEEESTCV